MYRLSVLLAALAVLSPFVAADSIADICGNSLKGTFCNQNGTALVSCAARTQTTCGVNEFCQVQGAALARCEPISRDAEDVCKAVQAEGLTSAIRCSNDVANVRISCPNALISKCPSGKVCVQSNSRYARCEVPAYTSEYIVVETFAAEVDVVSIPNSVPITMTSSIAMTTTMDILETVYTTPPVLATETLGSPTDAGFPTTLVDLTTKHVVGFATILEPTTLVHIVPTTFVNVEQQTLVQTIVETPVPTLTPTSTPVRTVLETLTQTINKPRTRTALRSTTIGVVTAIETIGISTTIMSYPVIETTPLATLTETVINTPIFTILPWTDHPLTEIVTLSQTIPVATILPSTLPDITLTVSTTHPIIPTTTATAEMTQPIITMTETAEVPTIAILTATDVYHQAKIVPTTEVYTVIQSAEAVLVLPTPEVNMSTELATATPLITVTETNPVTFTPTVVEILPTSEVFTSVWTSAVPGTTILAETAMSTDIATSTDVSTSLGVATTTVLSPMTTLIPTIATDTFIVCNTPVPTLIHDVIDIHSMAVTQSPIGVATQVVGTRTRGPNTIRTQTTVIAGLPTITGNEEDSIPMMGNFRMYESAAQPAMIKVQGACTTSYRVKFGYSTAAATATDVHTYGVTSAMTSVAHATSIATSVEYQTDILTAATMPMSVVYTSSLGVFTTAYPDVPTHTLDINDVLVPTVIEYTPEPFSVTDVGQFTTTMTFANEALETNVYSYTAVEPVTAIRLSTVYPALPTSTVLLSVAPLTTALVTEVPTVTATLGAETTLEARVTSTVKLPPVPASIVSTYVTKVTQIHTDVDVQTATSGVPAPTVFSTINVFPPIVQVTVTASATSAYAVPTLVVTTQAAKPVTTQVIATQVIQTSVLPAQTQIVQTSLIPAVTATQIVQTQVVPAQTVTQIAATATQIVQTQVVQTQVVQTSVVAAPAQQTATQIIATQIVQTQAAETQVITKVAATQTQVLSTPVATLTSVASATNLHTNMYTSTSTQVMAQTFLSTRTFAAVPTGNLVIRANPTPRVTVTSVQTAMASITQPQTVQIKTMEAVTPLTSSSMVTVTSTAVPVVAEPTTADAVFTVTANAPVATITATSTLAGSVSVPTPTALPVAPAGPQQQPGNCPAFAIGAAQYKLTAAGNAASGEAACAALGAGWALADIVDSFEFYMVGDNVCAPSYFRSWQGDSYDGACLAMYPGGATAVPAEGCNGNYQSLCKFVAA